MGNGDSAVLNRTEEPKDHVMAADGFGRFPAESRGDDIDLRAPPGICSFWREDQYVDIGWRRHVRVRLQVIR